MNISTFSETKKEALIKWREYKAAEKISTNPIYKELARVYNQIKTGRKVIDIFKAIKEGGVKENFHPKLAIAKATEKICYCEYSTNGDILFKTHRGWRTKLADVELKGCLPHFQLNNNFQNKLQLQAPVPTIPPKYLPKNLTDDYYILWEVDEWKMIPSTDPWLLRRLTKTIFVVLEGWDLTELEKSVMMARM